MGDKTAPITGEGIERVGDADPARMRAQIAETRGEMSNTIEQLHGRLNPTILKEQALEQFHDATDTVKAELKAHFSDAKEAMKVELKEAKELVRTELKEAKAAIKTEVLEELDAAKTRLNEEITNAKAAVRGATIGKVEDMVQNVQDKARGAGRSFVGVVRDNPVPAALVGVGLLWLFIGSRKARDPNRGADMTEGTASRALHGMQHAASAGGHQVSELAQGAGRAIAGATQSAASAVSHAAQSTGAALSSAAHRVQDTAGDLAHGAVEQGRRLGTRSSEIYQMNPIAVGVAVLAVGAAIGLALPRTQMEDKLLGSASDNVMDKAQELAHTAIGKAGDAAQHLADGAANHH